ncbi:hypothetical protein KP509_09G039800 [Ceratopteris richardii]|uniref:J domain-containing protein n=1 Tax=Ceratopteris richardii TaxID=49495 RepID=A0A8T2TZP2_CERRI|nr:hypothetical protein KP509_09G039800 [Ceratopteris richardii]
MTPSGSWRKVVSHGWQNCRRSYSKKVEDLYRELHLSNDASLTDVKQAYRRRALECHPDLHHNDGTEFRHLKELYEHFIRNGGPRNVHTRTNYSETSIFMTPKALIWAGVLLTMVLVWYPTQLYIANQKRPPSQEPSRYIEPSQDAAKRERIAAIVFQKEKKSKDQK